VRTTLDIADDVLRAARELARRERKTIGEAVSDLARRALIAMPDGISAREPEAVYGFRPFPSRGGIVTNETIDALREDEAA
jgi:hypothetical protein